MKLFAVTVSALACASAAPTSPIFGALNYGVAPAAYHGVAPAAYHGTTVQEHIVPAGPAIHRTHVQHGVVGHRTVQVGTQQVQVGHQFNVAGQTVQARPDETFIAEPAKAYTHTQALAEPVLPYAGIVGVGPIPAAPTNQGPAPADTVTHQKILAPGRVHSVVTPQLTRVEPQLQVNQVPYDVIQNVPVAVEREVLVQKHVVKPYRVDVEQRYNVPVPVPVNTVRDQYITPVVHKHTSSVSHPVAYATGYHHAAPVAAYSHVAPAAYATTH